MTEHHDQGDFKLFNTKLDTAERDFIQHMTRGPDDKEVAQPLIEDNFRRDA
jgi:hypothetical protein